MPPKKVMKSSLKKLGKAKVVLGKTTKGALGKAPVKKRPGLNKKNLAKLGTMTLKEKFETAAQECSDEEGQGKALKGMLTKDEHSAVWGKHQTHLKKNSLEKEKYDNASKKDKGLAAAIWLMKTEGKQYLHSSSHVKTHEALKKADKWESWKQVSDRFGPEELDMHIASGRVVWRYDPTTQGVIQYKDAQDWEGEYSWKRGKNYELGREGEPSAEDLEKFSELYERDAMQLGNHHITSLSSSKGFGKGKDNGKGKGKSKKGKGQLAIKDKEENEEEEEEPSEEKQLQEALKKARKARDGVSQASANLEEALEKAKGKLSRQGKAAAEGWKSQLQKVGKQLQDKLLKQKGNSDSWKGLLEEAAKVVKGAKDETKELKHLGGKAASVAPSKRSRASQ